MQLLLSKPSVGLGHVTAPIMTVINKADTCLVLGRRRVLGHTVDHVKRDRLPLLGLEQLSIVSQRPLCYF